MKIPAKSSDFVIAWEITKSLPKSFRNYFSFWVIANVLTTLFDIVAIGLVVVVMSVASSGSPIVLPLFGTVDSSGVPLLLMVMILLLALKSITGIVLTAGSSQKWAQAEYVLGQKMLTIEMTRPWGEKNVKNHSELSRKVDVGVGVTVSSFLAPILNLPGYFATLFFVALVILVSQPSAAVLILLYFLAVGLTFQLVIYRKAQSIGAEVHREGYAIARLITDVSLTLKELILVGKARGMVDVVGRKRASITSAKQKSSFLGAIPRYIGELAVSLGFIVVGGVILLIDGESAAILAISLFGISGFRMVPTLTAIQSTFAQVRIARPYAEELFRDLSVGAKTLMAQPSVGIEGNQAVEDLLIDNVSFSYGNGKDALKNVSFAIPFGSSMGIVGRSGSGKSTLGDLILGLLKPTSGTIYNGKSPLVSDSKSWASSVGYVPQEIAIFEGSFAQNVALDWEGEIDSKRVVETLELVNLMTVVEARGEGIHSSVGYGGNLLSGGQRQRLGIARALYNSPKILLLDEATSALDALSEKEISNVIARLRGTVTVVAIAHRLTTVRSFDGICYLDDGELVAVGTFDFLRKNVAQFRKLVELSDLGLNID